MAGGASSDGKLQRIFAVTSVFTPGAPIDNRGLFAGRRELAIEVINAIGQRGQHAVLYGERGVGKTSLANVFPNLFGGTSLDSAKINCHTEDDFRSLWRRIFRELKLQVEESEGSETWPDPEDVRYVLQEAASAWVIVIDELDRLESEEALSLLADTIKTLSDHGIEATLVLVGVADNIDELVGDHRSIERALVQVHVPRMEYGELVEIIDKGLDQLSIRIDEEARDRIARLSEGLPHYVHLLALHATQTAIADDRNEILPAHVDRAIALAVGKGHHSLRNDYQTATRSPRPDHLFEHVLLACALAKKDELGFFPAAAVRNPMSKIMGKPTKIGAFARHLNEFSGADRGRVLQKAGVERRYFYRFTNPILEPFVILNGLANGLVDDAVIKELQAENGSRGSSSDGNSTGFQRLF